MPVLFAGQSGPFAAAALRALLRAAATGPPPGAKGQRFRVVAVLEAAGNKRRPSRRGAWGFGRILGRSLPFAHALDLQALAEAAGLTYAFDDGQAGQGRALRLARRCGAVYAACAGYPRLWGPPLLGAFAAALNVHPSLLPRWRGPSPLFWWLRSGEPQTGVTVHAMVERADAGPAYARVLLAPPWQADAATLWRTCGELGGRLLGALLCRPRADWVVLPASGPASWAPRPDVRDATVAPAAWPGAGLLRFAQGAPGLTPVRLALDGVHHPVHAGVAFRPGASLPGRYLRQHGTLWVQARDGVVGLGVGGADGVR